MTSKLIIPLILIISLIITPIAGCVGNHAPVANFGYTPSSPTTDDSVAFSDLSGDSDGSIISWYWDFGDGNVSTSQNPSHTFAAEGSYIVTLTVTDNGGATDTYSQTVTVSAAPPGITSWDAIEILVKEIIPPAAAETRISAFMLSEPLVSGDVVSSEDGASYAITGRTWLIFIDDQPEAFYGHPTRYVVMDARTGDYDIYNDNWPPEINGYSMWSSQLGKGHLIELYSVLDAPTPITPVTSTAPEGDYGDAPDGQYAYYGITGYFPTLYNTTNSQFGLPGVHHLNVGEETLGLRVSTETDATDPLDPDGMPNLVDSDKDERIYVITELNQARLAFTVSVSLGAPDVTRYTNALIDFDYSGNWSQSSYGAEWVTVNYEVNVDPGDSETILTPLFTWANPTVPPEAVWMRLTLSRTEVDESLYANVGGWDGAGQFAYGETEDHFVFLTGIPPEPDGDDDWPPPGGNGNGNGGGGDGVPEPGPEEGPCGYDINYLVLIINCGDKASHIAQGTPIAQAASGSMADATAEQGYESAGNLGPGSNSLSEIGQAIADLAAQAKCGDHVLIYICGHGRKSGGISIYNSSGGRTGEVLTPSALADMLSAFDSCKDEDCGTPGCCHVSVTIESCYAGNFNTAGLNDNENIVVSGSSSNTPAQGCMPGGGTYTAGFVSGLQSSNADQSDPPNGVDPAEAHAAAEGAVASSGSAQQPWSKGNWCECKCPCQPSIDVEKWIWLDGYGWVKEIEAEPGDMLVFMLEMDNDGVCRDVIDLEFVDIMADCLEYVGESVLYLNGMPVGYREPDSIEAVAGGTQLTWSLSESEIGAISPGDSIAIEYYAYATEPGANVNWLYGSAHCSYTYTNIVTDQDAVTVWVGEEPQDLIPEEVLYGYIEVGRVCTCIETDCVGCEGTIYVYAQDLTQGTYPITYVAIYIGGDLFDIWEPYAPYFEYTITELAVPCYGTTTVTMIARNSIGLEVEVSAIIDTTLPCQQ